MSKKISDLTAITQPQMETGMEIEIEQEGVSYKVSLALLIAFLQAYFVTLETGKTYMPKSGGTFTGTTKALDEAPTTDFAVRNIKATATDPGVGSALATGQILIVYE
ncbi:MAG: hypothetical protein E7011_02005 [Alphaproteobacteria bacterium]|nr:hypothetical protein [Alphaproteobacteria bacterium]